MNWPTVSLGEVLTHRKEFITIEDTHSYKRCRVQLHAQGIVLRDTVLGAEIKTKKQQVCRADEFLVAEIDAKHGGYGIVPNELEGAVVSSHYFLFGVQTAKLERGFLAYYLRTPAFAEQVAAQGSTNYAAIRPSHVLGYTIPLPPVEEQRRIVARVDAIASRTTEARRLREEARTESEAYFCAVARGCFHARESWQWLPVDVLADVRGGIQKSPDRAPGANSVRYLTVAHVHRNRVVTTDPRFFEVSAEELERWRLLAGDVLIIEGNGSADQIGRTALFRGEIPDCVHQNHVIRIRPKREIIAPEYLNAFLNSPVGQSAVQAESRTSSGLRSLSVGRIKSIGVAVPPLDEQRRIVARLDALQAKLEAVRAEQQATAAELYALLPSVLNRAFAGQL
jgi:type I restriction enzyme S subunit